MAKTRTVPVPEGLAGMRVDAGVAKLLGLSRSAAAEIAAAGGVLLDGEAVGKSARLPEAATLVVTLPEPKAPPRPTPQEVDGLEVIYADQDVVCVNKPVGVAAHPTVGWEGPTVLGGLAALGVAVAPAGPPERNGIVQRLDVGTSGVMVVAASTRAYSSLKRAFKERTVEKTYHALVQGHPDPFSGTIDAAIGRHPKAGWKFAVTSEGKRAVTSYRTIEAFPEATLLEVSLKTGRTHQIRVHMSAINHPCCGDPMYGSDPVLAERLGLNRQWLHARRLGFTHPGDGRWVEVEAPYPADLEEALRRVAA